MPDFAWLDENGDFRISLNGKHFSVEKGLVVDVINENMVKERNALRAVVDSQKGDIARLQYFVEHLELALAVYVPKPGWNPAPAYKDHIWISEFTSLGPWHLYFRKVIAVSKEQSLFEQQMMCTPSSDIVETGEKALCGAKRVNWMGCRDWPRWEHVCSKCIALAKNIPCRGVPVDRVVEAESGNLETLF